MRLPIAAFFLLATLANAQNQNLPPKSSYEQDETAKSGKQYPSELVNELTALREAALADDYAYRQVAHLTENIGARPSGSPQAQAAVDYVAEELRKLGLEVRLEEVRVPHWIRGIETAELVEYPGQAAGTKQKIVLTALGASTPTSAEGLTAQVVVVNNFDELKNLGRQGVAGKIVLFNTHFDKNKAAAGFAGEAYGEAVAYRAKGAKAAVELGAIASLVRSVGGADYRLPHTGWGEPAGIPAGAVTSEDADLIAHLAAQGKVRMHVILTSQNASEVLSYNVVADLKGSEHPEQVVIVSGHLDSWDLGTGAIDDGAGVAVAMETAELIQRLHLHPKRTIRVIAWMDEENGGRGHDAYATAHRTEFANHVAAIESDLGASHPLGFDAKISANALPWLKPAQEILRSFGANLIKITDQSPGSDIAPMAKAGIPAFGIMQDGRTYFNYHHTAADTLDKIVPRELRENAAAMAVMGYALANLPETLPR
jgi:Iap family predicted aminopeptidase